MRRIVLVLLMSATAFAQNPKAEAARKAASQPQAAMTAGTAQAASTPADNTPKAAPEMEKLRRLYMGMGFSTAWQVEETYVQSAMMPNGGTGRGTDMVRLGPGGLSVINDYRSQGAGGNFSGHGVISWNPEKGQFEGIWVDNTRPGASMPTGKWDGENLVLTSMQDVMGQKMLLRETYKDITPESFTVVFDLGPVKGELKPFMTFKYSRGTAGQRAVPRFGATPQPGSTPPQEQPAHTKAKAAPTTGDTKPKL
jgi:hypothetical protein